MNSPLASPWHSIIESLNNVLCTLKENFVWSYFWNIQVNYYLIFEFWELIVNFVSGSSSSCSEDIHSDFLIY